MDEREVFGGDHLVQLMLRMLYYSSCNFHTHVFLYYAILHPACLYSSTGLAVINRDRLHTEKNFHKNLNRIAWT